MKTIMNSNGIVTKIFAETLEYEAYEQIKKMCNFEAYLDSKIRIMSDCHSGKGCTVGTTMSISDKITPNLVGTDISCGMLTVKLKDREIDFKKLDKTIKAEIPHGFETHVKSKNKFDFSELICQKHVDLKRASLSIGSLGGGEKIATVLVNS